MYGDCFIICVFSFIVVGVNRPTLLPVLFPRRKSSLRKIQSQRGVKGPSSSMPNSSWEQTNATYFSSFRQATTVFPIFASLQPGRGDHGLEEGLFVLQETLWGADLGDAAVAEEDDAIRIEDRVQAMGDGHDGAM